MLLGEGIRLELKEDREEVGGLGFRGRLLALLCNGGDPQRGACGLEGSGGCTGLASSADQDRGW